MADRFYLAGALRPGHLTLDGDEARHLSRVLRAKPGDRVEVFDGQGAAFAAQVVDVGRQMVELETIGDALPDRVGRCELTLLTAVPKGDRFDWLVEKATELGVARLVPILTQRSVVDPRQSKLDRLRRAVIEASKQCGRNRLMDLERPVPWSSQVGEAPNAARLIAHPGGRSFHDWPRVRRGGAVRLAIGPEGGFSDEEVDRARSEGWVPVELGATLLRIETAALAGCAMIEALVETGEPTVEP